MILSEPEEERRYNLMPSRTSLAILGLPVDGLIPTCLSSKTPKRGSESFITLSRGRL
ncbi:hypothetical protein YC2023_091989 [Brassica napus]